MSNALLARSRCFTSCLNDGVVVGGAGQQTGLVCGRGGGNAERAAARRAPWSR